MKCLWVFTVVLGCICVLTLPPVVHAEMAAVRVQGENDPRLAIWSRDFLAGKTPAVLKSVEADLRSLSPHPLAADIWTRLTDARGQLLPGWDAQLDTPLQRGLGLLPELIRLDRGGEYRKMLALLPVAAAAEIHSVESLFLLSNAADNECRYAEALDYARQMAKLQPNNFLIAWQLYDLAKINESLRASVLSMTGSGGEVEHSLSGHFLTRLLALHNVGAAEELLAAQEWLLADSSDPRLWYWQSFAEATLQRYDAAATSALEAVNRYPFRIERHKHQAKMLIRQGHFAKAEELSVKIAPFFSVGIPEAASKAAELYADALLDQGELGKGREVLAAAVLRWPDSAPLENLYAKLELDSGRPEEAVAHARIAVLASPHHLETGLRLIEALQEAGEPKEAALAFAALGVDREQKSPGYYYRRANLLEKEKRLSDFLASYQEAIREYPGSVWMQENLAYALETTGHSREALDALTALLVTKSPSTWEADKFKEWTVKVEGLTTWRKRLTELRGRYPWVYKLWQQEEEEIEGPSRFLERAALWRQAALANPGSYRPWSELTTMLVEENKYTEALTAAEAGRQAVATGPAGETASACWDFVAITKTWLKKEQPGRTVLEKALAVNSDYLQAGGFTELYHLDRADLLFALGREEKAAQELIAAALLNPDKLTTAWDLVTKFSSQIGIGRAFFHVNRYVERNPYDGNRLATLVQLNVMWGGSPINALKTIELIKERSPQSLNVSHESMAWGSLGDYAKRYEDYASDTSIGNSDRYLSWFEAARRQAQTGSSSVVVDYKTGLATIVHPDGQVELRQDHPISGKRILFQVGAAKIECDYDLYGDNPTRIVSSAGAEVQLLYDNNGTIQTLKTNAGEEVSFNYNEQKKPTRIAVKGMGEILVTYLPDGTIDNVDSPAGSKVALKVTSTFQKLLGLIEPFKSSGSEILPDLPHHDAELEKLRTQAERGQKEAESGGKKGRANLQVALLAEARYLVKHVADRRDYAEKARQILEESFADVASADKQLSTSRVEVVGLWHGLMRQIRKEGLSVSDWEIWSTMHTWLAQQAGAGSSVARKGLAECEKSPLRLLESARWLPTSYLSSPGFWRKFNYRELLPDELLPSARMNTLLLRNNHEVVVGTSQGISVLRRGYWEWFAYDENLGRFSNTLDTARLTAASDILSLSEDAQGRLWIGTAKGLVCLPGDYAGTAQRRVSVGDGLPHPRILALAAAGKEMLIGTAKGVLHFEGDLLKPVVGLESAAPLFFTAPLPDNPTTEEDEGGLAGRPLLVGTDSGLYDFSNGRALLLLPGRVDAAFWDVSRQRLLFLRHNDVYSIAWDGKTPPPGTPEYLVGQQDLVKTSQIYGIAPLTLDDSSTSAAFLTDQGLSIFHAEHFEHARPPLTDKMAGVTALATAQGRAYMLSSEGLFALERGQATTDSGGRVYDLLADDEQGLTFVARGNTLEVVDQKKPEAGAQNFDYIAATHLAKDRLGRLLVNDGLTILRYAVGSAQGQELFVATQTMPDDWSLSSGELTSLLAASDGSIWVTAGSSLFHWTEESGVEEFSIFVDSRRFPARSEKISRVVETYDHRIWVIASNEEHLNYNGMILKGGVLEWSGKEFRRLDLESKSNAWFITGYTATGENQAIVATANGFVRHRGESFDTFTTLKDNSYARLGKRQPALYLGGRGAKLGNDTWLFGTVGGIVACKAGIWFYPDRINWMLPEDSRYGGKYGVRMVHAVAVDRQGRIYIGNDRGLLIYDSGGGDATSFLIANNNEEAAFDDQEEAKLKREADVLLGGLSPDSEVAKKVKRVMQERVELDLLTQDASRETMLPPRAEGAGLTVPATASNPEISEKLKSDLVARRKAFTRLLLEIERENKGLYQMLELKPLDLVSLRNKLEEGQIVLQYLPTLKKLYIQLVTRAGNEIRQVDVGAEELYARIVAVNREMARRVEAVPVAGAEARGRVALSSRAANVNTVLAALPLDLQGELAWLYDQLLRPVEDELLHKSHIFVVPVSQLSYLPFSALLRSQAPQSEYAVERFTFSSLPSLYLFELMQQQGPSLASDSLVVGDPDGSLPGAREEANNVNALLQNSTCLVGKEATYEKFVQHVATSRVVHLATHGILNPTQPERSYLLLADNYHLSVVDAWNLPMKETEMVVLSACESGIGGDGLEYSTLARAFVQAGSPTVMATLWPVADAPSSALMKFFYKNLEAGDNYAKALNKAQRDMLKMPGRNADPEMWAGYVLFGRP